MMTLKMAAKEITGHHDSKCDMSPLCALSERPFVQHLLGNYLLHNVQSDEVSFRRSSTASSCKLEQNNIILFNI